METETRTPQGATLVKRNLLSRGFFVWKNDQRLGHVAKVRGGAWQAYTNNHKAVRNPTATAKQAADNLVSVLHQ